jgi:hypothetical protein
MLTFDVELTLRLAKTLLKIVVSLISIHSVNNTKNFGTTQI